MPGDAIPMTYELFEQFWNALVSRRKARKLDVDRNTAWRQLCDSGEGAAFLATRTRKGAKRGGKASRGDDSVTLADDLAPLLEAMPATADTREANARSPRTPAPANGRKPAARKTGVKRVTRARTGVPATATRKRPAAKRK